MFIYLCHLVVIAATTFVSSIYDYVAKGAMADVRTAAGGKIALCPDTDGHMGSGQQNQRVTICGVGNYNAEAGAG